MALKLQMALREGWKATQNERFGDVLELRFIDTTTDKIMFRYAPKLDDEDIFVQMFKILNVYDEKLKELKRITAMIEGRAFLSQGSCTKETIVEVKP